ncbi:hypothetical protein KJA13_01370 [Patescibacteria group bacterium]|nr:hypothetical protein [Patescibacteria group bacterium]
MKATSLLISLIFLFSLGVGVLAQETELPDPGLTPDSPFYFLEIIAEEIGTFFTFGDLKKAERHAALAAERLAEAQVIAGKGKPELTEKTLVRYENQLEKSMARVERAESKGENTEKAMEVLARVGQATSKHLEVLAEVYEKVPEEDKPAIENAMKASVKGHEKAVEALKAQNALGEIPEEATLPAQVPQEVRERVQMRAQQELEVEKAERAKENDLQSFESFRAFCIEQGAPPETCTSFVNELQNFGLFGVFCTEREALPPEMCEKIPLQGFESFEQIEDFCIEVGGTPELCSSAEGRCREAGVTTPDECFLVLLTATVTTSAAPSLSEEEMEERRQREEESRGGEE